MKQQHLARIFDSGIVAVIRGSDGSQLVQAAKALARGGVDVMELTFTLPRPLAVLEQVVDQLGDQALVGAGTILDAETARAALLAGAEYIVSPAVNLGVIETCRRYDKVVMPGALTPTEVVTAWQAGADIVKVFPADLGGPSYLNALRGPLPQVRLMPTGGVDLENLGSFFSAGACAVGVGGSLVKNSLIEQGKFDELSELASQYVEAVRQARQNNAGE